MRGSVAAGGAVLVLACAPSVASGDNGYDATWVSQTPPNGTVIESGELLDATMTFRNTGTKAWSRPATRLGPSGGDAAQRDRISALQAPSWIAPNRIAAVTEATVPPDGQSTGTFRFQFRGAPVDTERTFHEVVAPLHDGAGGDAGWMDGSSTIPFGFLYYDVVVRPSVPPTVAIDAAPDAVVAGQSVPVTATAADNVRVQSVSARIDGAPVAALAGAPAQGEVPTTGLAPGAHTLTVAAVDGAGNVGAAQRPLQVSADTGLANGTPAGPATLTAGLTRKGRARLTVGAGRRVLLGGRLRVEGAPTPIASARLDVQSRVSGARAWRGAGAVTTGADGRYRLRLGRGPSRAVRVVYRAQTLGPAVATRTVRLQTRAPVRLGVRLRGRRLRLTGTVPGDPFPRGGVLVSLQGKQSGDRWRPFETVRAKGRKQRFRAAYRFGGAGRFRLRAVVNRQSGYPYARGSSNVRRVRVR